MLISLILAPVVDFRNIADTLITIPTDHFAVLLSIMYIVHLNTFKTFGRYKMIYYEFKATIGLPALLKLQ